jgi:hypothetical protein
LRRGPLYPGPLLVDLYLKPASNFFIELGQQKSRFRISMQIPVENPLMTIKSFNRQFQVGEKEREAVKWESLPVPTSSWTLTR